ncbi:MAG: ARPP-1 family domain-containing protein [Gammaproteobacteria bacterium]
MQTITETLKILSLGHPTTFLNLTLFPLRGGNGYERDYVTLREAVRAQTASVREVSEGGSVPELLLENTGSKPVLILDGEELIGAKQNRAANVTILAPAGKTVHIPVTCVEAGRWAYRSRDFAPSEQMHFHEGRKRKMASVHASLRATGRKAADQGAVWEDIADKCEAMEVATPTSAMADIYRSHRTRVEDYVDAFTAGDGQIGAVFAIGENVEGLELFDCDETLADMLPKLIRSYAIDAIETVESHRRNPSAVSADAFISRLVTAEVETYPAVGEGTEVRLTAPGVIAGGLVTDERVVHLAAFAAPAESGRQDRENNSRGLASLWSRRRCMGR